MRVQLVYGLSIKMEKSVFSSLCRLCAETTALRIHIFENEDVCSMLLNKIETCLPVTVSKINTSLLDGSSRSREGL